MIVKHIHLINKDDKLPYEIVKNTDKLPYEIYPGFCDIYNITIIDIDKDNVTCDLNCINCKHNTLVK
jgi:hypothetical protein